MLGQVDSSPSCRGSPDQLMIGWPSQTTVIRDFCTVQTMVVGLPTLNTGERYVLVLSLPDFPSGCSDRLVRLPNPSRTNMLCLPPTSSPMSRESLPESRRGFDGQNVLVGNRNSIASDADCIEGLIIAPFSIFQSPRSQFSLRVDPFKQIERRPLRRRRRDPRIVRQRGKLELADAIAARPTSQKQHVSRHVGPTGLKPEPRVSPDQLYDRLTVAGDPDLRFLHGADDGGRLAGVNTGER